MWPCLSQPRAKHRDTGGGKQGCGHIQLDTVAVETDTEGDDGEEEVLINND